MGRISPEKFIRLLPDFNSVLLNILYRIAVIKPKIEYFLHRIFFDAVE